MKKLLVFTSLIELLLGIALIFSPSTVLQLLFGTEDTGSIIVLARFTGIVFLCFGIACFPTVNSNVDNVISTTFKAMFLYNFLATVYLGYMRFVENFDGVLLLPAVILHSLITVYFVYIFMNGKRSVK